MEREKPFFNFICWEESWGDLLGLIQGPTRFSCPDKYVKSLCDSSGRPIFLSGDGFDCHVYPPDTLSGVREGWMDTVLSLKAAWGDREKLREDLAVCQESLRVVTLQAAKDREFDNQRIAALQFELRKRGKKKGVKKWTSS